MHYEILVLRRLLAINFVECCDFGGAFSFVVEFHTRFFLLLLLFLPIMSRDYLRDYNFQE